MKRLLLYIFSGLVLISCDKFLEIEPNTSKLDTELVFKNDNTAIAALEAVYHELQNNGFASGNLFSITFLGNTLADDAMEYSLTNDRIDFYTNTVRADNGTNDNLWSSAYKQLYNINALLEGVMNNTTLTKEIKQRIEGEAKFVRAFTYYYLVHLYGEVPLVLTTDYSINQSLPRTNTDKVYQQIKEDLKDAVSNLPNKYIYSDGEHIRPTAYAAYTLLARMALWGKEYSLAVEYADIIIGSGLYELVELDEAFKANSHEAIWQLISINPTIGVNEGYHYILENNPIAASTVSSSALTEDLLSVWEPEDLRYQNWINVYTEGNNRYYYPFKYKIKNGGDTEEYSMVMRLAEVYLIRAEAYAMQGEVNKALKDLNVIRNRADLPDLTANNITDIQDNVLEERRRELFSEWGHRWLDLKRFGKIDEILGIKKPQWSPHAKLLPIPEQDILRNPFLTQNPDY